MSAQCRVKGGHCPHPIVFFVIQRGFSPEESPCYYYRFQVEGDCHALKGSQ